MTSSPTKELMELISTLNNPLTKREQIKDQIPPPEIEINKLELLRLECDEEDLSCDDSFCVDSIRPQCQMERNQSSPLSWKFDPKNDLTITIGNQLEPRQISAMKRRASIPSQLRDDNSIVSSELYDSSFSHDGVDESENSYPDSMQDSAILLMAQRKKLHRSISRTVVLDTPQVMHQQNGVGRAA